MKTQLPENTPTYVYLNNLGEYAKVIHTGPTHAQIPTLSWTPHLSDATLFPNLPSDNPIQKDLARTSVARLRATMTIRILNTPKELQDA